MTDITADIRSEAILRCISVAEVIDERFGSHINTLRKKRIELAAANQRLNAERTIDLDYWCMDSVEEDTLTVTIEPWSPGCGLELRNQGSFSSLASTVSPRLLSVSEASIHFLKKRVRGIKQKIFSLTRSENSSTASCCSTNMSSRSPSSTNLIRSITSSMWTRDEELWPSSTEASTNTEQSLGNSPSSLSPIGTFRGCNMREKSSSGSIQSVSPASGGMSLVASVAGKAFKSLKMRQKKEKSVETSSSYTQTPHSYASSIDYSGSGDRDAGGYNLPHWQEADVYAGRFVRFHSHGPTSR